MNAATTVLIPAAGRVPEGMLGLSNIECPAMIPVAGRPVIAWTLAYLRGLGLRRARIAVARRGLFIEDFVARAFADLDIAFVVPPADRGVGGTVAALAADAPEGPVLVVLGDTHFQFAGPAPLATERPFVLARNVAESYRWCVVETDHAGRAVAFHDKRDDLAPPHRALIGVYGFPSADGLRRACERAAQSPGRIEMSAILTQFVNSPGIDVIDAGEWLDAGNPDRQAAASRSLIQKRAFNELEIDERLGTITKRSHHADKLAREIAYLRALPPEIAVLFPRIVASSTEMPSPWVTMEFYGYPTLAQSFLFENVHPGVWRRVFAHLHALMTLDFARFPQPVAPDALRNMLVGKTRERLASPAAGPVREIAAAGASVRVNGRAVRNMPALWEPLERAVSALTPRAGTIVHGDLCFSNVLYDMRNGVCKLLDPRGEFGRAGIGGDARYDVAKLYHSVRGLYDAIVADLFSVHAEPGSLSLSVALPPRHAAILRAFEETFFGAGGFDRREITLITACLFASMVPLHADAPARQLAFYATALQLFDEVLS